MILFCGVVQGLHHVPAPYLLIGVRHSAQQGLEGGALLYLRTFSRKYVQEVERGFIGPCDIQQAGQNLWIHGAAIIALPPDDLFTPRSCPGVLFASHGMGMPSASIAVQ